jgi:hypothetical protein
MTRHYGLIILAAVLASGCAEDASPRSDDVGAAPSTMTGLPRADGPGTSLPIPAQISWNECRGMGATLSYHGNVFDIDGGHTPPGWEPDVQEDHRYYFMVNRCERVAVGPFERGPVHFLYEAHGGVEPPQACIEFDGGADDVKVLLGLWVDDPEVASYLRESLAMPVIDAAISLEVVTDPGNKSLHHWTWSSGQQPSEIFALRSGPVSGTAKYVERLAWHNGTAVTLLDLHEDKSTADGDAPTAHGTLAPPMAYSSGVPRPFVGLAGLWDTSDHHGPITRFGDLECAQQLS